MTKMVIVIVLEVMMMIFQTQMKKMWFLLNLLVRNSFLVFMQLFCFQLNELIIYLRSVLFPFGCHLALYCFLLMTFVDFQPENVCLFHFLFNDMRMIQWMCNVSLKDRLRSDELRGGLNLESIGRCVQNRRLRWFGHILREWTRVSGLADAEQLRCQVQLVEEGQRKHGKK